MIKLDSFVSWGICLRKMGQQKEAFEKYQSAIDLNPKYAIAYYQWGVDLLDQGQYGEAIIKFERASLLNDPVRLDALGLWGVALERMGKNNEALAKYKEVIDSAPNTKQADKSRNSIRLLTEKDKNN
jgi:tetratricopeptide (TPR) repeat protein